MSRSTRRLEGALNIADLREAARRHLARGIYEYLERGVEDDVCLRNNRAAFERIKLLPRVLRDVSRIDTQCTILGQESDAPLVVAPTGGNGLLWYCGDTALARAAATARIPFTISTASTVDVEKIALANGRQWYQLYLWENRALSHTAMKRAWSAGCDTLMVTADMPVSPNREFMARTGFASPFRLNRHNTIDVLSHPLWAFSVLGRYIVNGGLPRQANLPLELKGRVTEDPNRKAPFKNDNLNWEQVKELRSQWPGKFVVKGILRHDDAETAVSIGVDGIVISNHGGRSMDCSIASIDVLPSIARLVKGRVAVLFDSGIQRGTDIFKALALGADAVLIGRAPLYGLAVAGEIGAAHAIGLLKQELIRTMAMTGSRSIAEINEELISDSPCVRRASV